MPTIDSFFELINLEKQAKEQYYKFAEQAADNSELQQFLKDLALKEEKQIAALEERTRHLLEVEKW